MTAILRALRTLFLASFTFTSACIVTAQTNPFVGTWKFVPERSHFDRTAPKDIKLRFLIDKDQLREEVEITLSNGAKRTWVFIPQYDHQEHPLTISGETNIKLMQCCRPELMTARSSCASTMATVWSTRQIDCLFHPTVKP